MVLVEIWMSRTEQTILKQMGNLIMILKKLTIQKVTLARWWTSRSPNKNNDLIISKNSSGGVLEYN